MPMPAEKVAAASDPRPSRESLNLRITLGLELKGSNHLEERRPAGFAAEANKRSLEDFRTHDNLPLRFCHWNGPASGGADTEVVPCYIH
jgi:hypothetical protein